MKVTWIVEKDEDNRTNEIVDIINSYGDNLIYDTNLKLRFYENPKLIHNVTGPIMTIGSLNLCLYLDYYGPVAHRHHFCTIDNYRCSKYYPEYHYDLVNKISFFTPFSLLTKISYNEFFPNQQSVFIRPDSGNKCFSGQVVNLLNLKNFVNVHVDSGYYSIKKDTMCVVAQNTLMYHEYRIFCDRNGPISGSLYKTDGKHIISNKVPTDVYEYASDLIKVTKYIPDPVFCMDINFNPDNSDCEIIELNSFSASGFYGSDLLYLMDRVRENTVLDYETNGYSNGQ